MRIAVLGGGNGSFAAAGDFALAGHEVRLWRRDAVAVNEHVTRNKTVVVKDGNGSRTAALSMVTTDMASAVKNAELIFCPSPATSHEDIAKLVAPHLVSGQVVFLTPGTLGTLIFAKAARAAGTSEGVCFAETGTLPWLVRKHGPFEVAITIRAVRLPFCGCP